MKFNTTYLFIGLIVLVVAGLAAAKYFGEPKVAEGAYDEFAQCLTDNGATFYGAFWCPHCREQKAMFGSSVRNLNYVECSTSDQKGQTKICIDKEIKSYPTWEFSDGERKEGVIPLAELAAKANCALPEGV